MRRLADTGKVKRIFAPWDDNNTCYSVKFLSDAEGLFISEYYDFVEFILYGKDENSVKKAYASSCIFPDALDSTNEGTAILNASPINDAPAGTFLVESSATTQDGADGVELEITYR